MKHDPRKRVLLVDNSLVVRERLLALISELPDVDVIAEASTVTDAIRKNRRFRPEIVVLDISLADGNGIQVLEAIKSTRRATPHVIMLTNFALEAYRERCLELGAEYFFDKSAEFEQAVQTIKKLSRNNSRPAGRAVRAVRT
jgi:DNA-binding NarL/FixJ family response regulator